MRIWIRRLQPWLGALLLGLGTFVGLLALSRGDLKAASPALIAVGGASLIANATYGRRRWAFVLASVAAAVAAFAATEGA